MDDERYRTILFIDLLGGLGDLLMALPAIHALAQRHRTGLHVLTHSPGAELLAADPAVASVRTATRSAEAADVAGTLEGLRPDLVVSTTRHSGIPGLVAATGCRAVTNLWRQPPPDQRVTERYLRILAAEGLIDAEAPERSAVHLTSAERERGADSVRGAVDGRRRPPVVLLPAAGMAVKQWPGQRWAALAARLAADDVPVLVSAESAPPELPGATALPPTTLRGLAARFAEIGGRGGVAVGADTGPMRLAVASGTRAVALFGPTVRGRYGLFPDRSANLQGLPGCEYREPTAIAEQPCWWTGDCPLDASGPACMADIGVDTVLAAVLDQLDRA
jgi:ADP-heptose:LPS heptosyltransferase